MDFSEHMCHSGDLVMLRVLMRASCVTPVWGFPDGSGVKNLPAIRRLDFDPWVGKVPWRREWQPTPVFLPGEFHGQRSLAGHIVHGVAQS